MSQTVRTRFAPSPTGYLHVGGARTALFNWLYARRHGGKFVLRIEDTDAARNTPEAREAILGGLRWLGLDWDEGPGAGSDHGPYFQSERKAIYDRYFQKLTDQGSVYDDGGAMRFRSPGKTYTITDHICGSVQVDRSSEPDMTIRRPDGSYIFHFVNVVDDIEMGITHVIRGEDHLMNTAKHLELYHAFGSTPPEFAHIPLILNEDGSKMSKRDTGASLGGYTGDGYLPEAVRNYLCLLGWSPKDDREMMPLEDVTALFDWSHLNRSNARFDIEKCTWLNSQYIAALDVPAFRESALPFLTEAGIPVGDAALLDRVLAPVQEKVKLLKEVPSWVAYFFDPNYPYVEAASQKAFSKEGATGLLSRALANLEETGSWDGETVTRVLKATAKDAGAKPGAIMLPCRVALTGQDFGPGLGDITEILGKEETLRRLRRTVREFS